MLSQVLDAVMVPPRRRVHNDLVNEIICHRVNHDSVEEYLLRWAAPAGAPTATPLSWHPVNELSSCIEKLQQYLESLSSSETRPRVHTGKNDRRLNETKTPNSEIQVYNGELTELDGMTVAVPSSSPNVTRVDIRKIVTHSMLEKAQHARTDAAERAVRQEVLLRLERIPGPKVGLINEVDNSSPPLSFTFIDKNILGDGVHAAHEDTITGCTKCRAHMGQGIGCEYSKLCDCLEYAAVNDTERMLPEERARWDQIKDTGEGDTTGLPKKFPYFSSGPRAGCLVPFYLERRTAIYECNLKCKCGPTCKTRVVQHGRKIPLEIFKTPDGRGWGIRCKTQLRIGQFVDTYRGEIITDAEASRRESLAHGAKDSYLYSLDKFAETCGFSQEQLYVIDGQFYGGPTRFLNHSCDPNCRQYVVSYNKHDPKVYEIAFFATRDIASGEELTFDYLDKEDDEDQEMDEDAASGKTRIKCRCGTKKCRRYLWL
ncbi:hypothetical protein IWX90DRAFT_222423 [Phyllosticta citrichinensis]|uniref:SET domain-containing protein n=1 Tax=Phyllosticta citrichinensis TaxID=1130410 RepID=A0ABR1XU00_9PEZI